MKKFPKPESLPALMGAAGLLALLLHRLLFVVAVDAGGLPLPGHPLALVLLVLTLAVTVLAYMATRRLTGTPEYGPNFPAGTRGAVGCAVFAFCILGTVLFQPCAMAGVMSQVWRWLGLGAALALLWIGLFRHWGKVPYFGLYLLVCLFLGIHVTSHYRVWSGTSQVRAYLFPLLGGISLLFYAYYQMAFTVGFGNRRKLLCLGMLSIYLGLAGLLDTAYPMLWLGSLVWVWTSLCAYHVPPAPEKPQTPPEEAKT
ncbi:MAG: hypothetical protein Q4F17_03935 [Eubacteriales bacterium]|nr:hypothetical protein [Eubacteriales bacterium]